MEDRVTSPASEEGKLGYLFEQFRMPRGCLGYVVADPETRLAAIVDPELEMVEPMIDFVFEHGLRPAYIIDSHTHADHVSGARNLKSKTVAKLVMHQRAPSSAVDIRVEDGDRLHLGTLPSNSSTPQGTPRTSSASSCQAGYSPPTPFS
jgi:glyoxylase-like metal-dependent hydrolase (beta-lactamase superfamily II)